VPVDIRASLQRALRELEAERTRVERQISVVADALKELGGSDGRRWQTTAGQTIGRRRRRRMTLAQRKAVSERMRRYWAERRKAKALR
jgi:hypothetical protein